MEILSSFEELPCTTYGIRVVQEMSDDDRMFLEQNVQATLAQKEIDLEDAMAIRQVKDIDQAQRLLAVRRKKRIAQMQQQQQSNIQAQAQANAQAQQQAMQMEAQKMQMEAQLEAQKIQLKGQVEVQVASAMHQMRKELEMIRAQASLGFKADEKEFREKIEVLKEDRKDERIAKRLPSNPSLSLKDKDREAS